MDPRRRDGLLALVGLASLLAVSLATVGVDLLLDPAAVTAGALGAVLLEIAFLRYPGVLLEAWERRGVPVAGLGAVVIIGAVAVRAAPGLLGVLAWGLATYLALLGCVLAGVGDPLAAVARRGSE